MGKLSACSLCYYEYVVEHPGNYGGLTLYTVGSTPDRNTQIFFFPSNMPVSLLFSKNMLYLNFHLWFNVFKILILDEIKSRFYE